MDGRSKNSNSPNINKPNFTNRNSQNFYPNFQIPKFYSPRQIHSQVSNFKDVKSTSKYCQCKTFSELNLQP